MKIQLGGQITEAHLDVVDGAEVLVVTGYELKYISIDQKIRPHESLRRAQENGEGEKQDADPKDAASDD